MTHKQPYNLYIADCSPQGGITVCRLENGKLTVLQKVALDRPTFLALEDDCLAVPLRAPFTNSDESGILTFKITNDGRLTPDRPLISTQGVVCCHLCMRDGQIFDANYLSGSVNRLGQNTVTHTGHGVDPTRQEAPHVHFINFSPDGRYLFSCDLGLDTLFVYTTDLVEIERVCVPGGHGIRHLAYALDGKTVYAVNELTGTLSVFDYTDGHLTYLTTVDALPPDWSGENTAAAVKTDGQRLYVSHRGLDKICVFDCTDRIPTYRSCFATGGHSPRDFELFGSSLVVTNESGPVTVFDRESGQITDTLTLAAPLCVIGRPIQS